MWYNFFMILLSEIQKSENYVFYNEFYDFLIRENEKFNITAITDKTEFMVKNVCDCVDNFEIYFNGAFVLEIGSGGGFPSVPLKIKRNDLKFTLIESNEKKHRFLKAVSEKLGFSDFSCVLGRAEDLSLLKDYRENYDYGIARAVAPLNVLCELILPFVKVGGYMIAYKGPNYKEEISSAESAVKILGGKIEKIIEYSLDLNYGSRALVMIKKENVTPDLYPRKFSKIKKQPL